MVGHATARARTGRCQIAARVVRGPASPLAIPGRPAVLLPLAPAPV